MTSNTIAPDQNRTDTHSLEGYCSTIELQAHLKITKTIKIYPFIDKVFHSALVDKKKKIFKKTFHYSFLLQIEQKCVGFFKVLKH